MRKLLTVIATAMTFAAMWAQEKSIVVLYENDVHCATDGYARMAGLRDAIAAQDTAYVIMVSSGDFLQGGTAGALSQGQYVADVMRKMGYQAITLGNHEFDYGTERMQELLTGIGAPVTCVNLYKAGSAEPCYAKYVMLRCGERRIAFVGALTPETMLLESYAFYDTKGQLKYDLRTDSFYSLIQQAADEARNEGADYVVALLHVGEKTQSMGFNSHLAIAATRGIDAVADGHSHSVVPGEEVKNRDGKDVRISQTGTQFANVGKLLIKDGHLTTTLIPTADIPYVNAQVKAANDSVTALMKSVTDKVAGTSRFPLKVTDAKEGYSVRCRETNAGDLVTDAYRHFFGAEIALENGGALRTNIAAGTVTYGDIVALLPYYNNICLIKATGAQIIETLKKGTAKTPEADGSFPQCSGLKYTVNTASHTVSDVMVEVAGSGEYVAIDPERIYDVAVDSYYRKGGFYNVLKDCHVVTAAPTLCRDVVEQYIRETLGGVVPERYANPQGRICIVDK